MLLRVHFDGGAPENPFTAKARIEGSLNNTRSRYWPQLRKLGYLRSRLASQPSTEWSIVNLVAQEIGEIQNFLVANPEISTTVRLDRKLIKGYGVIADVEEAAGDEVIVVPLRNIRSIDPPEEKKSDKKSKRGDSWNPHRRSASL